MEKALYFNDKKYISAKRAAEISGYSSDYVEQLCRADKIDAVLVGRSWYVSETDLQLHKQSHLSPYAKKSKNIPAVTVEKKSKNKNKNFDTFGVVGFGDGSINKSPAEKPISEVGSAKNASLLSYESEDNELFPTLKKELDPVSTRFVVSDIIEKNKTVSKFKTPYFEKFIRVATFVSILTLFVSLSWVSDLQSISSESIRRFASQMLHSYSPVYTVSEQAVANINSKISKNTMLASASNASKWGAFSSWVKNIASQMVKPWIEDSAPSNVIVQNKIAPSPETNTKSSSGMAVYYSNTYVEGSDRQYVDMKIAELKQYFLTSPTAPNVNRYYVTNQNDRIVESLSHPITSLSDVTIGGSSSFSGSANISTLSVSGAANFTGSTTVADLTVTEWLAVGTTTQYEALTLDGVLYLGTNTAPANTTYRLYNTNNGDLYWNGSLMAGATVGNWTTDGTSVWRTAGNVGVGTTSPFASLSVVGDAFITRNLTASNITATGTLNVSGLTTLGYASSTGLTVSGSTYLATAGGNVGIGTTNPQAKLEIAGGVSGAAPSPRIKLTDYYDSVGDPSVSHVDLYGGQFGFGISWDNLNIISAADFNFLTGATSRMVIKGGNVGIATTSPYRTLSVVGSGVFTGGDVLASTFTATSSITTPSLTLSSVAINSLLSTNSSGAVVATSAPTFGYFNATSTAATSTISGGLAIETSGFVYDYSTNNVGIGTASPAEKLHVNGVSRFAGGYVQFFDGSTLTGYVGDAVSLGFGGLTNDDLVIRGVDGIGFTTSNGGSDAVYINSNGNVGIGTTSPNTLLNIGGSLTTTASAGLNFGGDVLANLYRSAAGTIKTDGDFDMTANKYLRSGSSNVLIGNNGAGTTYLSTGSTDLRILANSFGGAPLVTILNSGNFGIGSTTPGYKLSVTGSGYFDGGTVIASQFIATSSISTPSLTLSSVAINSLLSTNASGAVVATSAPTFGYFNATSTAATSTIAGGLAIETSGFVYDYSTNNVGIGTASPTQKLDVNGAVRSTDFRGTGTAYFTYDDTNTGSGDLIFRTGANAWNMVIKNGGNVGIGTTGPGYKLEVQQTGNTNDTEYLNAYFSNNVGGGVLIGYVGDGTDAKEARVRAGGSIPLALGTTGSKQAVYILNDGNVGIGTTSPGAKLNIASSLGNTNVEMLRFDEIGNAGLNGQSIGWHFANDTWGAVSKISVDRQGSSSDFDMSFSTMAGGVATNNALVIKNSGNVGIGTTSPGYKLSVQQTSEGNTFQIYDTDGNCLLDPDSGGITTTCSSDARLKTNIEESNNVIEYLRNIPIKDFTVIASGDRRTGVIAQEMLVDYPELVHMGPDGYYGVSEISSWKIIKGLQEQQTMIEDLQSGQADIVLVEQRLTALEIDTQATSTTLEGGGLSLIGRIMAYFKGFGLDIQSGFTRISKVFVGSLHIEGDVCVDDTCVTKDQFKEMILRSGVGAVQIVSSTAEVAGSSDSGSQISTSTSAEGGDSTNGNIGTGDQTATSTPEVATSTPEITPPTPLILSGESEAPSPSQGEGVGDEVVTDGGQGGVSGSQNSTSGIDTSQSLTP